MTNERSSSLSHATSWRRVILLCLAAATIAGLFVVAFAGSATHSGPRDVPLAVTGGEQAARAVQSRLEAAMPGAFEVRATVDRGSATTLITERDVYGAVLTGPDGPAVMLTASAASPAVAQVLTGVARQLQIPAEDLIAPPAADPRGIGLASGALPITIGGIALGTMLALLMQGLVRRLVGLAVGALLVGTVAVSVLHAWLGSLAGNALAEIAVVSLGVAAIAGMLVGLYSATGRVGLILADLAWVLIGNPLSGATSAPELLPAGWGEIGRVMPLGATIDALRGVSGFAGAGTATSLWILLGWIALGLTLMLVSRRSRLGATPGDDSTAASHDGSSSPASEGADDACDPADPADPADSADPVRATRGRRPGGSAVDTASGR